MSAIDYLTKFEKDALHLYELLEHDAENSELRTTFGLLAKNQRRHMSLLLGLCKGVLSETKKDDSVLSDRNRSLTNGFERLLENHGDLRHDPDGFWHIMNAEQECIRLMEGVAQSDSAGGERRLLERLVTEEKKHLEEIESIYEFVTVPHTYLEWGEFSNLHSL